MKARILAVTLVVMILSALLLGGRPAQAQGDSRALSVEAVEGLFAALDGGNADSALAFFVPGASVQNWPSRRTYLDADQIAAMLSHWQLTGRRYSVLTDAVVGATNGLDIVTADVEISDRGLTWGQQRLTAVVHEGQIQRLYITHMRLTPWQYW